MEGTHMNRGLNIFLEHSRLLRILSHRKKIKRYRFLKSCFQHLQEEL